MKFTILTIFPDMFNMLNTSIIKKASEKGLIQIETINIRDFSNDKHHKVDFPPYGGGSGMVMSPLPIYDAYMSIDKSLREKAKVIYLSPKGKVLNQKNVLRLAKEDNLILIAGHYEGVDQRVLDEIGAEEISIGDYILTGGELPAMVLIDSVSRYIDGVISKDSLKEESFSEDSDGLLEHPHYTRPELFRGRKVPEVLLSGHHENIRKYRKEESLKMTLENRPELINKNQDLKK